MTDRLELLAVIALGFLLDQVLGDPHWLYHPVRIPEDLIEQKSECDHCK